MSKTSKRQKLACKIGTNGTVYIGGGGDMPLLSLQRDVRSGQVAGCGSSVHEVLMGFTPKDSGEE